VARLARRRYPVSVGGLRISSYTALLYVGCVAGVLVGAAVAGAEGLSPQRFALTAAALLAPAFLGARVWFLFQHRRDYREEPREIWRRSGGGMTLYGGVVAALVASVPLLYLSSLPFWPFWDAAAAAALLGVVVSRVGCFMHGCCAGRATKNPLGMWLPNERGMWQRRFPTPILEALWAASVLLIGLTAWPRVAANGELFAVIMAGYAVGRLLLEPTREAQRGQTKKNLAFSALLLAAGSLLLAARVLA